jgi:hypothetical protein
MGPTFSHLANPNIPRSIQDPQCHSRQVMLSATTERATMNDVIEVRRPGLRIHAFSEEGPTHTHTHTRTHARTHTQTNIG